MCKGLQIRNTMGWRHSAGICALKFLHLYSRVREQFCNVENIHHYTIPRDIFFTHLPVTA